MAVLEKQETNSILNIASGKTLIVDGSLSEKCSKALMEIYKKDTDEETGIVLESQVIDMAQRVGVWQAMQSTHQFQNYKTQTVGLVYGVGNSQTSMTDFNKVQDAISSMSPEQKEISAIYLEPQGKDSLWSEHLRVIAEENDVRVVEDLDELGVVT